MERIEAHLGLVERKRLDRVMFGSSPPSTLVGEKGYPLVFVGPNIPPALGDRAVIYESPRSWWGKLSLEELIRLRSSLIFSRFRVDVRRAYTSDKLLEATREIALSIKPVDTEVHFEKPPRPRIEFDGVIEPIGPAAKPRRLLVASSPVVPRKVDQLVYDEDVKVREALAELYVHGVSIYHMMRLLSLGMLGRRIDRRLVPTRWAITAVDSTIGDILLTKVRGFNELNEYRLYNSEYLGNRYVIIMAPGPWTFEMIEIWLPRSVWVKAEKPYIAVNYELHDGKPRVDEVDGGYYAMRSPVLEYLYRLKRQATVIAIREVTPNYYAPVGVWQVRESVRAALEKGYEKVEGLEQALIRVSKLIETPIEVIVKKSRILRRLMYQTKLRL